jgi:tRNA (guanine37-N1)-methyltransferase
LKPGGMLHFYDMQHTDHRVQTVQKIERICVLENRKLDSSMITRCGHCAPRTFRVCVDARIC